MRLLLNQFSERAIRVRGLRLTLLLALLVLPVSTTEAQPNRVAAEPKEIVFLHSFGSDFKPWSDYATTTRAALHRQSPWPLNIVDHALVMARSSRQDAESPFISYLQSLYAGRGPDLIISFGAPAAAFVQRHRSKLFPATPTVLAAVEQRNVQLMNLTAQDAVVAVRSDFVFFFESIFQVLPNTRTVAVVNGASPLEQLWLAEMRRELKPIEGRIEIIWYSDRSFEQILKHAANLPPNAAIFWQMMNVDAAGVVHEGDSALRRLHEVANVPIFSYQEAFFGRTIVGGPMHSVSAASQQTAHAAIRILGGAPPRDLGITEISFAPPKYDWRELQRWNISESRLPTGSEVQFRSTTYWEQNRSLILGVGTVLIFQSILIAGLIYEHRRRHLAEVAARSSFAKLTHMDRMATAGELAASIAHEISQPLTGIVARAGAGRRWLANEKPRIDRAKAALEQIESAGHRASDIVKNVKSMFGKDDQIKTEVNVNELIGSVLKLISPDLRRNRIDLYLSLDTETKPVLANAVQLQQVVLNLVMNAIDAMRSVQSRVLSIASGMSDDQSSVRVSVEDTGNGIDRSNLEEIFKPFFTTKERGMGMGLAICGTIIQKHEGRIWATPSASGGSIFWFEIPIA